MWGIQPIKYIRATPTTAEPETNGCVTGCESAFHASHIGASNKGITRLAGRLLLPSLVL